MKKKKDKTIPEAPAFPITIDKKMDFITEGLTKREWMATMILSGTVASDYTAGSEVEHAILTTDLLIKELNRGKK